MFQNMTQGAPIYVLYKNTLKVSSGKVMSVNTHMPTYNPQQPMAMLNGPVTDISVQVDNETIPFSALPANAVLANFPDKGVLITEDRSVIVRELEGMISESETALKQAPTHEQRIARCKEMLIEFQPEKKREAQQQQEISLLKSQLAEMNGKFDDLVGLLSARFGDIKKSE